MLATPSRRVNERLQSRSTRGEHVMRRNPKTDIRHTRGREAAVSESSETSQRENVEDYVKTRTARRRNGTKSHCKGGKRVRATYRASACVSNGDSQKKDEKRRTSGVDER